MTAPKPLPIALPVTIGTNEHGFNANVLYDAGDNSIALLYGLPQSTSLDELRKDVAARVFNGIWEEGLARADYIAMAVNAFPVLLDAVQRIANLRAEATGPAAPLLADARAAAAHALAAAGVGEPKDQRAGWSTSEGGTLHTSVGTFDLVAFHPANQGEADKLARYIADAITLLHRLGGAGL